MLGFHADSHYQYFQETCENNAVSKASISRVLLQALHWFSFRQDRQKKKKAAAYVVTCRISGTILPLSYTTVYAVQRCFNLSYLTTVRGKRKRGILTLHA